MMEAGLQQAQRFHPDAIQREVQEFWKEVAGKTSGDQAPNFFSLDQEGAVVEQRR
jgi:hypothetical protein